MEFVDVSSLGSPVLLGGTWSSLKVKCDSLKYHIQMGVNDQGAHFRTWGGGQELTPHC